MFPMLTLALVLFTAPTGEAVYVAPEQVTVVKRAVTCDSPKAPTAIGLGSGTQVCVRESVEEAINRLKPRITLAERWPRLFMTFAAGGAGIAFLWLMVILFAIAKTLLALWHLRRLRIDGELALIRGGITPPAE